MRDKEKRLNKLGLKLLNTQIKKENIRYVVVDKNHGKKWHSFQFRWKRIDFKNQKELELWVLFQEKHGRFNFN